MIWTWFARRSDLQRLEERLRAMEQNAVPPPAINRLDDRIDEIEHRLAALSAAAAALGPELDALRRQLGDATLEVVRMTRHVGALRRMSRAGGVRVQELAAQIGDCENADKALDRRAATVAATLSILEHRLDTELEQSRRAVTGLFERIEALRRER